MRRALGGEVSAGCPGCGAGFRRGSVVLLVTADGKSTVSVQQEGRAEGLESAIELLTRKP